MKQLFTCLLLVCGLQLQAQTSFTNMPGLIGSGPGGGGTSDCTLDMNGDFLDDIVRVNSSGIYIDYQQPDGSFTQTVFPMSLQNLPTWSIVGGDLDRNGYNDLLFGSGDRVSFLLASNDGSHFTETVEPTFVFSQRSTLADIDNDGDLDAFVCHDVDQSVPFRNDGSGNMTVDQSLIETSVLAGNYAAIWVDYDNDWDSDLYITKCRQGSSAGDAERTNLLYRNNGDGTYTEVGAAANMDDNSQSWATVFEDFDNDGDFDAFIVNHDFTNLFKLNNGDGTFTDIIGSTGIDPNDLGAWENASGDFNNDGFVDIFSELGSELYLNNGDLTFTPVNLSFNEGGIGDFNNDGFLDVVNGSDVWINDGNDNNWVKINTEGIVSNKNGVGARVEIYGDWGVQIREVRSGQSFSPMSSLCVHFGLGQATSIDQIVVKWPSGMVSTLSNPAINSIHNIPEAGCLLPESTIAASGELNFCPGNSVELSAPAGFDSYTWSNGESTQSITVGSQGTYWAYMEDAGGCISVSNNIVTTLISEVAPSILADQTALVFCQGGAVTLNSATGDNPTWSNGMVGGSVEITESGEYTVSVDPVCAAAPVTSLPVSVTVLEAPQPEVENVVFEAPGPATFAATGENVEWYDAPDGGNLLGSGDTFETDELVSGIFVWVESHTVYPGEEQAGGKPGYDLSEGGLPSVGAHSFFDAYEPFTIREVTVFVPSNAPEGERTITLYDGEENQLDQLTLYLTHGEHQLELNFEVPAAGTDYHLACEENNLFRNNAGVSYPYPIGTVGELTGSVYGNQYYYYFYNWQIQKPTLECVSERVQAAAIVSGIGDEPANGTDVNIYPNPAYGQVTLSFELTEAEAVQIRLFDLLGKEVKHRTLPNARLGENKMQIDLKGLAAGVYQLQLTIGERSIAKKLVVE